jgi:CheY-like chemotaxis protein
VLMNLGLILNQHKMLNVKESSAVLIVDDSDTDAFIHARILERIKRVKEIHTASNGRQALDLLTQYSQHVKPLPQIIFLDLNMPIMDGFAFVEAFRKTPLNAKENVKIVIVTSSSSQGDMLKAKELGIQNFMIKPMTEEKFLKVIGLPTE